jgi:hypothetical protein
MAIAPHGASAIILGVRKHKPMLTARLSSRQISSAIALKRIGMCRLALRSIDRQGTLATSPTQFCDVLPQ